MRGLNGIGMFARRAMPQGFSRDAKETPADGATEGGAKRTVGAESREGTVRSALVRDPWLLGWAFLLAWVFCVFYAEVPGGHEAAMVHFEARAVIPELFFLGLPVLSSVAFLLVIVLMGQRGEAFVQHPWTRVAATFATALPTALLYVPTESLVVQALTFALGSLLVGFGSAILWVLWGERYARAAQEDMESVAPAAGVLAGVLCLAMAALDELPAIACAVAFPLVSGVCLARSCAQEASEGAGGAHRLQDASASADAPESFASIVLSLGRVGFGILTACLFTCLVGMFGAEGPNRGVIQLSFGVGVAFMLIVGLTATALPRRVTLSYLYRWMCPLLVTGFAALVVLGEAGGEAIVTSVTLSARFAFCLLTQMYFARYVMHANVSPIRAYGLGWMFVHMGDFLGVVSYVLASALIAAGEVSLGAVCSCATVLLTTSFMLVLNNRDSFIVGERAHAREEVAVLELAPHGETEQGEPKETDESLAVSVSEESRTMVVKRLAEEKHLTPRETEVFGLLARGRSVPYVRDALMISKDTVATHTKHIYQKLEVHSRQELIDLVESAEAAEGE